MSAATEIAEREAAAAEAENPDAEPAEPIEGDPDPEPEPEPDPTEPSSQTVVEDYEKKMKSEATRHENALAKLHPDTWDKFAMCPLCIGEGFLEPIKPGEQPEELWEAITVMAGRFSTNELESAPFAEVCETCKGKGMVLTGAQNETNYALPCRTCAGYGWLDVGPFAPGVQLPPNRKQAPPQPVTLAAVPQYPNAPVEPYPDSAIEFVPFAGGVNDPYGRPAGHPRWGMPTDANGRQL